MIPRLDEIRAYRAAAAQAALSNDAFLPIFERLDQDCQDTEALLSSDPVAILRAQIEKDRREAA